MQLARPAIAVDPRRFGRGRQLDLGPAPVAAAPSTLGDDAKLFLTTMAAGFIFVTVLFA